MSARKKERYNVTAKTGTLRNDQRNIPEIRGSAITRQLAGNAIYRSDKTLLCSRVGDTTSIFDAKRRTLVSNHIYHTSCILPAGAPSPNLIPMHCLKPTPLNHIEHSVRTIPLALLHTTSSR